MTTQGYARAYPPIVRGGGASATMLAERLTGDDLVEAGSVSLLLAGDDSSEHANGNKITCEGLCRQESLYILFMIILCLVVIIVILTF